MSVDVNEGATTQWDGDGVAQCGSSHAALQQADIGKGA
jgi:hypothetical protein